MVKSKKMSKSAIAIIILSLLLVLSMVMGLTGAWFTDKATGSAEKDMRFGTVALSGDSMALEITSTEADLQHVVDKDTFTLPAANLRDTSNVNVYVAVYVEKELYREDPETGDWLGENYSDAWRGYFKAGAGGSAFSFGKGWNVRYIPSTADVASRTLVNESSQVIEFDSAGAMNESGEHLKIVYKVYVVEIQAKNIASQENLVTQLNNLVEASWEVEAITADTAGLASAYNETASALNGRSTTVVNP